MQVAVHESTLSLSCAPKVAMVTDQPKPVHRTDRRPPLCNPLGLPVSRADGSLSLIVVPAVSHCSEGLLAAVRAAEGIVMMKILLGTTHYSSAGD